jgi:MoxR-like ATPase
MVPSVERGDVDGARHHADALPPTGYVYDDKGRIALAVNVALATQRPLLVRGKPGTGKTSLAADVAQRLGRRYYEHTVTSRTRAADVLWTFDAVRRLSDASGGGARDPIAYVLPGVLWWAFAPGVAATRGLSTDERKKRGIGSLDDPSPWSGADSVVLIDEIDKADPDVPNDLLLPLGALRFTVTDTATQPLPVAADNGPLVVVTTNEERDLPAAFLRRCVVLSLPHPSADRLLAIARAHFGDRASEKLLGEALTAYSGVREQRLEQEHEPSPAEFLDIVAAAIVLRMKPAGRQRWGQLVEFALRKPGLDGSQE